MQIAVIVLASIIGELLLGVGLGSLLRRGQVATATLAPVVALPVATTDAIRPAA